MRFIVIAAVKNDLALVAAASEPYMEFGPGVGPGRRRQPTCNSLGTWANMWTVSAGAVTLCAEPTVIRSLWR